MNLEEEIRLGNELREMVQLSRGYKQLEKHINETIQEGWDNFIKLSPEKKTSKASFHYQAQYQVLKDLKDWITDSIRSGEQEEVFQCQERAKRSKLNESIA